MVEFENNAFFWQKLDTIWYGSGFILTADVGNAHPQYKHLVYPVPYGYLKDTTSATQGIPAFRGSDKGKGISAIIVSTDILIKDVEVKVLIDCTAEEEMTILVFLNQTEFQKTLIVRRGVEVPSWSESE